MGFQQRLKAASVAAALVAAVAAASASAQSVQEAFKAWEAGRHDEAVQQFRALADSGNADAQFALGHAYRLGRGVPQNLNLAEQWYERAARGGHREAQAMYGVILFQNGRRQEALPYIQRGAESGDPRAQYVLGTVLFNGDYLPADHPRAYALMTRSAAQGLPQAESQLREMDRLMTETDRTRGRELAEHLATLDRPIETAAATAPAAPAAPAPNRFSPTVTPESRPVQRRVAGSFVPGSTSGAQAPQPRSRPDHQADRPALAQRPAAPSAAQRTAPTPPRPAQASATPRPAAPQPTPTRPAASGRWRVQLGAFSNEGNARRAWDSARARLPGLQVFYVRAGALTRVQAGPLADRAAAERSCAAVRGGGGACLVVAP